MCENNVMLKKEKGMKNASKRSKFVKKKMQAKTTAKKKKLQSCRNLCENN